jgi:hypothetical protein
LDPALDDRAANANVLVFGSTGQACVPRTNLPHALAAHDNSQDAGEISFTVGFFLSQGESTEGRASTL